MKNMFAKVWLAASIAFTITSAAAFAQYYAPVVPYAYAYSAPAYSAPPPYGPYGYRAPALANPYYGPPTVYYGPYVLYYWGDPVRRFWNRQERHKY